MEQADYILGTATARGLPRPRASQVVSWALWRTNIRNGAKGTGTGVAVPKD